MTFVHKKNNFLVAPFCCLRAAWHITHLERSFLMTLHRHTVCRAAGILCIAAAFALLTGCTPASPSSTNEASVSSALNQTDTDSVLVLEGEDEAGPSSASASVSSEENGLPAAEQEALDEALNACLGWGPGSAGSSLHSVVAAAALLDWAQANGLASGQSGEIEALFADWYDTLDEFDKDTFSETWPLVCDEAALLLEDAAGMAELMETAGVDPARADGWASESWEVLHAAIDGGSGC